MRKTEDIRKDRLEHGRGWRLTLASGIVTLVLSAIAFALPEFTRLPRGGLVGWLLLIAGLFEFAFGMKRGFDSLGRLALGSGLITSVAGLLFVLNPSANYWPVVNIVTAWLFLRGCWVLTNTFGLKRRAHALWCALTGTTDVLLAIALLGDLPLRALVYSLFGPTDAIVARFSLVLAFSFVVTGIAQLFIGLDERRRDYGVA